MRVGKRHRAALEASIRSVFLKGVPEFEMRVELPQHTLCFISTKRFVLRSTGRHGVYRDHEGTFLQENVEKTLQATSAGGP